MAIAPTALSIARSAGQAGHVSDTNAVHSVVNDLSTIFTGWTPTMSVARSRAVIYHDPANKADGAALTAGTILDSGQPVVNNVGTHPLGYSGGKITHTESVTGSPTAGYLQVQVPSGVVRRLAAYVSWPANAIGAAGFVVPSAFWNQSAGLLPVAGFHVTMYGNGLWVAGIWNPSSGTTGHVCEILSTGAATAVTLQVVNGGGTQTTASLNVATMTAGSLQTALGALSNVGGVNVAVTKSSSGAYGITWAVAVHPSTMTITAQTGSGATVIEVTANGVTTYASDATNGRYSTVWDSVLRLIDIWLFPETNQAVIYFPDGTNSGLFTHPGIGLWCGAGYGVFELFENNISSPDVPASFGKFSADNDYAEVDAPDQTKVDVTRLLTAARPTTAVDQGNTTGSTINLSGGVPPGTTYAEIVLIGATAGGGSGGCASGGAAANGGGSGSSAGMISTIVPASALSTTWSVAIPAKGSGGASVSTGGTIGNPGSGTTGSYARFVSGTVMLSAYNGAPGPGGTLGANAETAAGTGFPFGQAGVIGPINGAAGTTGVSNSAHLGTAGSGAGGGITSGAVANAGGAGGANLPRNLTGGTGGVVGGAAPGVGTDGTATTVTLIPAIPGPGVGGGAASSSGAAQAGAAPIMYGAGGGGGGASASGNASGAGGNGIGAYALVKFHFS